MVKKKRKKKRVKKSGKKKRFYEFFKIRKKGREKTVKVTGSEEIKLSKEDQIKHQNKLLRNILIGLGVIIIVILLFSWFIYSVNNFEYRGVDFNVVKEGNLIFYNTAFPMMYEGKKVNYNFYIRNDPRKLEEEVPFEGEFILLDEIALNSTNDFVCDGDGTIAIANFLHLGAFGAKIGKVENATCDPERRYMFIELQPGNETKIEKFGPACYNFYIHDCEILKVTERFMVETFVHADDYFNL